MHVHVLVVHAYMVRAHNLGRNGPRNSVVTYTPFLGRSVVVAQTVDSLNGGYLQVP